MKLAILLGLSALLGTAFHFNPSRVLISVISILVAVPASATQILTGKEYAVTGGGVSLLPTTVLVCGVILVGLLSWDFISEVRLPIPQTLGLWMVLSTALIATIVRGGSGIGQFLDSLCGPIALFCLILVGNDINPRVRSDLRISLIAFGVVEAVLGLAQYWLNRPLLFEANYAKQQWFSFMQLGSFRSMGTFDHPLTYALFMLLALSVALTSSNRIGIFILSPLFIMGIAASGSRTALLGSVIIMLMSVFAKDFRAKRVVLAGGLGSAALVTMSPMGDLLAARLSDDGGSFQARQQALDFFIRSLPTHLLWGSGIGSSGLVAARGGVQTSLESPLLIMPIEIGLAMAILFVVIMIYFALGCRRNRGVTTENYGTLVILGVAMTYSSFAVKSEAGYIVWVALALAASRPLLHEEITSKRVG